MRHIGKLHRDVLPGPKEQEIHAAYLRLIAKAMRLNNPQLLEETAQKLEELAAKR